MLKILSTVERKINGNIYLNVEASNTAFPYTFGNVLADFEVTRDDAIIERPKDYDCVITRFSINGGAIPLLICPIQPAPNTNINLSTFAIFMEKGGVIYKEFLIYTSVDPTQFIKVSNLNPDQDTSSYFYFIYDYQILADMMNVAFASLYATLGGVTEAPVISWNPVTQLFSISALYSEFLQGIQPDGSTNPDPFLIYFNAELTILFAGFLYLLQTLIAPILLPSMVVQPNEEAELLRITITSSNLFQSLKTSPVFPPLEFKFTQQYKGIGNWTAFKSIVFFSNNFPSKAELVGDGKTIFRVLKDFIPNFPSPDQARDNLKFDTQGEFQRIALLGTDPLTHFNLQIFWRNVYDDLIIIPIDYLQKFSIRFLFEPKIKL